MLINWARLRRRRSETRGKNINNFRFKDDTILLTERNNDLKLLLMKVKEVTKARLQLNIKTKITTTEEIHTFNIDNEDIEIVKDLLTLAQSSIQMETAAKKPREG